MVKYESQQPKRKYRGSTQHKNKRFLWTPPHLLQRIIGCFAERSEGGSGKQTWEKAEDNCKASMAPYWDKVLDNQRAMYVAVDSERKTVVRRNVDRKELAFKCPVAYPSDELAQEVKRILPLACNPRFYRFIIGDVSQDYVIYIVFEGQEDNVIYVGKTRSLINRISAHRNGMKRPDDTSGFIDYARYRHEVSDDWGVYLLRYNQCASLAVQGQLTPDLINNEEARRGLTSKYSGDHVWGLQQAELALIAYFRPHFNQLHNVYPRLLQRPDYCLQQCRVCLPKIRRELT